ncbi:MAG TPA: PH domain-containing protein [Actinopolymorphaceae bacterium]
MAGITVAVAVGAGLLVAALAMWFGLPAEERALFSGVQVVTLLLFLGALLGGLYGIGRTRLTADTEGLTVVNAFRTHRLVWPQVVRVNFGAGDPWVVLDLDDGTTVSVMALQSADGERARRSARALAALVDQQSRSGLRHGEND